MIADDSFEMTAVIEILRAARVELGDDQIQRIEQMRWDALGCVLQRKTTLDSQTREFFRLIREN